MSALISSAPLLLRRRGAVADLLPIIAFAAAAGILATVLGGFGAFAGRGSDAGVALSGSGDMDPESEVASFLVLCALVACVLLVPSALGLGGSAARLSLARREKDLATMRLVGGTTAQVGLVAVADVVAQALIGTVVGIGAHLALTPALTHLDFGIAPFTVGELLMPWWGYPLLLVGIVVLAAGSAAISLSGVALSPLGVARESRTVRMSIIRVLVWVVLLVGFVAFNSARNAVADDQGTGTVVAIFAVLMAMIVGSLNLVGPFIIWVAARIVAALAPFPALMVGARRLAADPRGGWRSVSGITFALVVAGVLTAQSMFPSTGDAATDMLNTALKTGGLLTLAISAVLAAVSTGVTQTARVIDQAPVLHAQHVSGAQVSQLHRARIAEIAIPLVLSSIVAMLTSLVMLVPVMPEVAGSGAGPIVQFVGCVLGAYALVLISVLVGGPLVRKGALDLAATA
jgi:hypothetical protein